MRNNMSIPSDNKKDRKPFIISSSYFNRSCWQKDKWWGSEEDVKE